MILVKCFQGCSSFSTLTQSGGAATRTIPSSIAIDSLRQSVGGKLGASLSGSQPMTATMIRQFLQIYRFSKILHVSVFPITEKNLHTRGARLVGLTSPKRSQSLSGASARLSRPNCRATKPKKDRSGLHLWNHPQDPGEALANPRLFFFLFFERQLFPFPMTKPRLGSS
jgi:hypothetical protein